jgi:DNA-binding PadR family transcriptional regulator
MAAMRMTYTTALVLQALLEGRHHGFDIMDATGLPSGTVYPILRRLDADGAVRSRWEREGIARREQRPARRYYELTAGGTRLAREAVDRARRMARAGQRLLRPAESEG